MHKFKTLLVLSPILSLAACDPKLSKKVNNLAPMAKMHFVFDDYLGDTGATVKIIDAGRAKNGRQRIVIYDAEIKRKWLYYEGQKCHDYKNEYITSTKTRGLCEFGYKLDFPK